MHDTVIEARRVNNRVMSLAIVVEEVLRVACAYAPQSGISMKEKEFFMKIYQENGPPFTQGNSLLELEILIDMLAEKLMDFRGIMEHLVLAK